MEKEGWRINTKQVNDVMNVSLTNISKYDKIISKIVITIVINNWSILDKLYRNSQMKKLSPNDIHTIFLNYDRKYYTDTALVVEIYHDKGMTIFEPIDLP